MNIIWQFIDTPVGRPLAVGWTLAVLILVGYIAFREWTER